VLVQYKVKPKITLIISIHPEIIGHKKV